MLTKNGNNKSRDTYDPIPQALYTLQIKQYLLAAVVAVFAVAFALTFHDVKYLLLMLVSLFLLGKAFSITWSFRRKDILEETLVCHVVQKANLGNVFIASFSGEDLALRRFRVTKEQAAQLIPELTYRIYYNIKEEEVLIAFTPISV